MTETPLHRLLARMACRPELLVMLNFICSGRFERILKRRPLGELELCSTRGTHFTCVCISFSNSTAQGSDDINKFTLHICQFVRNTLLARVGIEFSISSLDKVAEKAF